LTSGAVVVEVVAVAMLEAAKVQAVVVLAVTAKKLH
jgi:hypothetical protein